LEAVFGNSLSLNRIARKDYQLDMTFRMLPSSSGHRLVYVQSSTNTNIWQLNLQGSPAQARKLIVSSAAQGAPSISPDGRRIAFESNRNGTNEVWVCDGDGSNALQLTFFGVLTGTPRWSPDGGLIAFDSRLGGESNLYTVDPAGGVQPN
jgi:Tol biopolymer transport system component